MTDDAPNGFRKCVTVHCCEPSCDRGLGEVKHGVQPTRFADEPLAVGQ